MDKPIITKEELILAKESYLIPISKKITDEHRKQLYKLTQIKASTIDLLNEIYSIIDSTYQFSSETIQVLYDNLKNIFDRPLLLSSLLVRDTSEKEPHKRIINDIYNSVITLAKKCVLALSERLMGVIEKIDK